MATDRTRLVVGTVALLAFVVETCLLGGTLEWFDAYIDTAARTMQNAEALTVAAGFTKAAPFLGAAFVSVGVVLALRSGTSAWKVAAILVQFAVGLLLVGAVKVFFERARPGALPWDTVGDSFPSGHVANALLCVGTALRLAPRRSLDGTAALAHLALIVSGMAYVPAVAFTRLVLARHWMTDVTGSLLLGGSLIALAPAPRPAVTRRLLLALPPVLVGMWVSVATGSRIHLPSPSTLWGGPAGGLRTTDDSLSAVEIDDDALGSTGWTGEQFTLLAPTYGKQWVDVRNGRGTILKLCARMHLGLGATSSLRLELLVDGTVIGSQLLETRWRTLAFALPALEPGSHEFELLALQRPLGMPRRAAK